MNTKFYCLHCNKDASLGMPLLEFKGEQICAPFCSDICLKLLGMKIGPKRSQTPGLEEPPSKSRKTNYSNEERQIELDTVSIMYYGTIRQLITMRNYDEALGVYKVALKISSQYDFKMPVFDYDEELPVKLYTHTPNDEGNDLIPTPVFYNIKGLNSINNSTVDEVIRIFKKRDDIINIVQEPYQPVKKSVIREVNGVWIYDIAKKLEGFNEYRGELEKLMRYVRNEEEEEEPVSYNAGNLFSLRCSDIVNKLMLKTYNDADATDLWQLQTIKTLLVIIGMRNQLSPENETNMLSDNFHATVSKLIDISSQNISTILNLTRDNEIRGSIQISKSVDFNVEIQHLELPELFAKHVHLLEWLNIDHEIMAILAFGSSFFDPFGGSFPSLFVFNKYLNQLFNLMYNIPNGKFLFECSTLNFIIAALSESRQPKIVDCAVDLIGSVLREVLMKYTKRVGTYNENEREYFKKFISPVLDIFDGQKRINSLRLTNFLYFDIYVPDEHEHDNYFYLGTVRKEFEYFPEESRQFDPDNWYTAF